MAYSYYTPAYAPNYQQYAYQPNYAQQQAQPMQQPIQTQAPNMQPTQPMNQPVIQNGGFITVRSESEARSYPVAPGTSVSFKHETAPYCYTKTMGFNQFEAPRFEKFRLVKEEDDQPKESAPESKDVNLPAYAKEEDLGKLAGVVKSMSDVISNLKSDIEVMRGDLYGAVGKRKAVKKAETETEE